MGFQAAPVDLKCLNGLEMKRYRLRQIKGATQSVTRYKPSYTIFRSKWEMHKNDADPNPSVPHGHSLDQRYKLDVWNGDVISTKTNEVVGRADKKEIQTLHKNNAFKNVAREAIRIHQSLYPTHQFYIPDWLFDEDTSQSFHCSNEQEFSVLLTVIIKK